MSRLGNVNWKRLGWAVKETFLSMLFGVFLIGLVVAPIALALITDNGWWFLIYAAVFFIGETWETYEGR